MWSRWKAGQSEIGRALGKDHVVIQFLLAHHGGSLRLLVGVRGGHSPWPARARTPSDVAALADLGPRVGDGPAQKLHDGYGRTGLLL